MKRAKREETEARLLGDVECAKARYEAVKAEYKLLIETSRDVGHASPDGATALKQATTVHARCMSTLDEYSRALRTFNRFIVFGRPPDEPL